MMGRVDDSVGYVSVCLDIFFQKYIHYNIQYFVVHSYIAIYTSEFIQTNTIHY